MRKKKNILFVLVVVLLACVWTTERVFAQSLNCTNAIALTSGVSYNGTTVGGNSDVSAYFEVPYTENAPEKVHTITLTTSASLEITLTGMSKDLDIFLLSACDENQCFAYSADTGNESISQTELNPGTYYIVVDGFHLDDSGEYTLTATSPGAAGPNSYLLWTK